MGRDSSNQSQRHRRMRSIVIAVVALLALTFSGCNFAVPNSARPLKTAGGGDATSVHVLRTSAFPQNHIPPLDQMVTDSLKTQNLYAALQALPPTPSGTFSCPADFGEAYHLTFYRGQQEVFWADVKPDGCRGVTLQNGDHRWAAGQDHFWTVFADALGVSVSDLSQMPRASGPSAPQPSLGAQP
jgi:hypothetical protein